MATVEPTVTRRKARPSPHLRVKMSHCRRLTPTRSFKMEKTLAQMGAKTCPRTPNPSGAGRDAVFPKPLFLLKPRLPLWHLLPGDLCPTNLCHSSPKPRAKSKCFISIESCIMRIGVAEPGSYSNLALGWHSVNTCGGQLFLEPSLPTPAFAQRVHFEAERKPCL